MIGRIVTRFASRLRFPTLFGLVASLKKRGEPETAMPPSVMPRP